MINSNSLGNWEEDELENPLERTELVFNFLTSEPKVRSSTCTPNESVLHGMSFEDALSLLCCLRLLHQSVTVHSAGADIENCPDPEVSHFCWI